MNVEVFKTAHLLMDKYGTELPEAINEKIKMYIYDNDLEAIRILREISSAVEMLNASETESPLPN